MDYESVFGLPATPPKGFRVPRVHHVSEGLRAFDAYLWHIAAMKEFLLEVPRIFLVPCVKHKPIQDSHLHRHMYRPLMARAASDRERLIISEGPVLIRYPDLYRMKETFCHDFPPDFLGNEARIVFVTHLRHMFRGKDVAGCLPPHYAKIVTEGMHGATWKNCWTKNQFTLRQMAPGIFPIEWTTLPPLLL